jgi:acetoacetyl-CoA reductase
MSEQKLALITGGTGGIGTAICRSFSEQGIRVYANYYPAEENLAIAWQQKQKEAGFDIAIIGADVSSYSDCEEMVSSIEAEAGPIDILINAAGITRDKTLRKMEESDWSAVMSTNLDSIFNVTKQVFEGMTTRGFGRIVNISSVNGQRGQFGQANYATAKAGMHGFTMTLAQEGAAKGVTVNTVSPGYISTAMTQAIPQEICDQIVAGIPARKMGQPEDIANVISFLASDSNGYITGANIPVNGGLFMSF